MRVFFDASVLIAALLSPSGGSAKLMRFVQLRKIVGITSETVIAEMLEKTTKIGKSKEAIETFIAQSSLLVRKAITISEIAPYQNQIDTEDIHLIAGAILTHSSHLVSLDKRHVLHVNTRNRFFPLKILPPKELLEEIVSQ